jgi:hypothetical protein
LLLFSQLLLSLVSVVAAQQWWRSDGHSDGNGGTAMAMAVQQWLRWRSVGNG